MNRFRFPFVLALVAACVAAVVGDRATAAQPAPPAQRPAAPPAVAAGGAAIPRVTVSVRAGALDAPAAVPTGFVSITFRNEMSGPFFFAGVLRLKPGATVDAVLAAFEAEDEEALDRLATGLGGSMGVPPGQGQEITFDFRAGEHVIITFDEETEMPVTAIFRATPPPVATQPPPAAGEILIGDFFFRIPAFRAGTNTFRVTNSGRQLHHMIVARLSPGVTLEQVFEAEEMGTDPLEAGLVTLVPGLSEISPGETAYPALTFTPGNYAMVCFITDPETGKEHVELGMVEAFTVR